MDLQDVIDSHIAWKRQLFSALRSDSWDNLDPGSIGSHAACAVGQWIQDQSKNFGENSVFATLQAEHGAFHHLAATLVQAGLGNASTTERMLMEGRLQEHSYRVLDALRLLKLRGSREPSSPVQDPAEP